MIPAMNPLTILIGGTAKPWVCCSHPECPEQAHVPSLPYVSDIDGNLRLDRARLQKLITEWNVGWTVGLMRPSLLAVLPDGAPLPPAIPVCFCPAHKPSGR